MLGAPGQGNLPTLATASVTPLVNEPDNRVKRVCQLTTGAALSIIEVETRHMRPGLLARRLEEEMGEPNRCTDLGDLPSDLRGAIISGYDLYIYYDKGLAGILRFLKRTTTVWLDDNDRL